MKGGLIKARPFLCDNVWQYVFINFKELFSNYEIDFSSAKYTSDYKTAKEVMDELKELPYWRKIILHFLSNKKIKKIEKTLEKSAPRVYTS